VGARLSRLARKLFELERTEGAMYLAKENQAGFAFFD
jgi:hypothetical protein